MAGPAEIWSVGHSSHGLDRFLTLLKQAGVTAIADVRSAPYSRRVRHFNREPLLDALIEVGIAYVWLGDALGGKHRGRPPTSDAVDAALGRIVDGSARYRVALMCTEADPARCHRARLVAPLLVARGHVVRHLLADGSLEEHSAVAARIAALDGRDPRQESLL